MESVGHRRDGGGKVGTPNRRDFMAECLIEPIRKLSRVATAIDGERTVALPAEEREDYRIRCSGDAKQAGQADSKGVPRAMASRLEWDVLHAGGEACARQAGRNWVEGRVAREKRTGPAEVRGARAVKFKISQGTGGKQK